MKKKKQREIYENLPKDELINMLIARDIVDAWLKKDGCTYDLINFELPREIQLNNKI